MDTKQTYRNGVLESEVTLPTPTVDYNAEIAARETELLLMYEELQALQAARDSQS